MRRIPLVLMFLLSLSARAQNYQCLQSGVKHYFINKGGYLRGIRIDSTNTYTDSIVYYPYHTPRGRYQINPVLDSNGGSWLGKRVLQLNDGTILFDNMWQDTVVIKTQANPGDSWMFYNDTTNLYYQAHLLSTDTMTVLGVLDSVKKILITARNPSGIVTTDPVNNFHIWLSKDHGFVQVFDLYTFPYHAPDSVYEQGLDYYADYLVFPHTTLHDWSFSLINLINPTMKDLYQWNIGDVYQYSSCDDYFEHTGTSCYPVEHYITDTITSISTTGTDVTYAISRVSMDRIRMSTGSTYLAGPPFYEKSTSIQTKTFNLALVFDLTLMPEEYKQPFIYYYLPNDTALCSINTLYVSQYNNEIWHNEYRPIFEHFTGPSLYKAPLGLLDEYSAGVGYYGSTNIVHSQKLIYYNRSGASCGEVTYPPTKVNQLNLQTEKTDIFPNPVTDILTINSTSKIASIDIVNLLGQVIISKQSNKSELKIDISTLPNGVYFVRINSTKVKKFIKQ